MAIQKKNWRKIWLDVHLYIGLTIGLIFALLGLTGSVNVFHAEIDEFLNPELAVHAPTQAPLPLDAILTSVQTIYPEHDGAWWFILRPDATIMTGRLNHDGKVLTWLNVNPYSGKIVRTFSWDGTLVGWIYTLHDSLLAGDPGRKFIGVMGLVLLVSALSGLYLWWPRGGKFRRSLTIKRGASRERFIFDLHQVAGIYSLVLLIILGVSGIHYVYPRYLGAVVNLVSPVREVEQTFKSAPVDHGKRLSIAEAVAAASQVFPGAELKAVTMPNGADGVYIVRFRQASERLNKNWSHSMVWLDPYSGALLHVRNPENFSTGETFMSILGALHSGEAFGLPSRILIFLTGLILPALYVTGLIRWLDKRKAKKSRGARARYAARREI